MSDIESENNPQIDKLLDSVESLEKRLSNIESILRIEWLGGKENPEPGTDEEYEVGNAESNIVEYGLAWLGSIVFLFGIIFLMSYTESLGYLVLSKVIAYFFALLLIAVSYFLRQSFPILVNVLKIISPLLLYYITIRLHFFTEEPLISQKGIVLVFLFVIIGMQLYEAIRKKSEFLGVIAVALSIATAIISDSTYITFLILTMTAIGTHLLFYGKLWWRLHIFSLFVVYLGHLMWLFHNPIMGHKMGIVELPQYNIMFLFGYGIIYSFSIFIPKEKLESNAVLVSISLWNALGFSLLLLMIIPSFYKETYVMIFSAITCYAILFSVILKLKSSRNFAPATYACFGFVAFSIALFGYLGLPNAYFLLVLQSLIVVSLALWYRSKIIVVANTFLFVSILLIYLITSESIDAINFAFAITAIATARILGWQKERLTLQTDIFRNIYLVIATFMILYGLNQALPSQYVTFAWTGVAIGFFLLSILLRNIKYRYLSIFVIVVTAGHLFFIDLGQMATGFRVIAFLAFSIISIGVSLYYTKRIRNK